MANTTIYIIDTTDGSDNFAIQPRTFDGNGGVQKHTDITLYGNATPNWGEKFNENFYKILENFAVHQQEPGDPNYSATEPRPKTEDSQVDSSLPGSGLEMEPGTGINNAIVGQGWFNKTDQKLYVCYKGGTPGVAEWKPVGASTSQPQSPTLGDLWYDATASELKVYNGVDFVSSAGNYVLKSGDTMGLNADITFNGGEPLGLPAIPSATAAASKEYVDSIAGASGAVLKTGDTMTGYLTLNADPINPLHAATQQYVNNQISAATNTYVNISGDTMTGTLNIDGGTNNDFVGLNLYSLGGPVIKLHSTSNTLNGSRPPSITMYNPDNDAVATGSSYNFGYLRLCNRDSSFFNVEADQDDNGSLSGVNTKTILDLSQNGTMYYYGDGLSGDIQIPNATISSINNNNRNVTTKEYVDNAISTSVAGVGGLVHIETLKYTNFFDVSSSNDTLVSGFQISYTTPNSSSSYNFSIKASLNVYMSNSGRPTYWTLKEGGTVILDAKISEGLSTYSITTNTVLMASGTMLPNTTYTFNIWVRNSIYAPLQNARLNASEDFPNQSDPYANSTMELMVFG